MTAEEIEKDFVFMYGNTNEMLFRHRTTGKRYVIVRFSENDYSEPRELEEMQRLINRHHALSEAS